VSLTIAVFSGCVPDPRMGLWGLHMCGRHKGQVVSVINLGRFSQKALSSMLSAVLRLWKGTACNDTLCISGRLGVLAPPSPRQ
jgi:hypothetical protein